jgi:hypothetical protein
MEMVSFSSVAILLYQLMYSCRVQGRSVEAEISLVWADSSRTRKATTSPNDDDLTFHSQEDEEK